MIPDDARIVYRGVIFTVYQWDQRMFDGTTAVFERATRPDSAQVIPVMDGKVLLARERQPDSGEFWGLFGGVVEEGEDPLAAAKRELLEEAGLESDDWKHLFTAGMDDKLFWRIPYYVARDCRVAAEPRHENGERIEIVPVDFDRFLEIICEPSFRSRELTLHVLRLWKEGRLGEFRDSFHTH